MAPNTQPSYSAPVPDRPPFRTAKTTDLDQWDLVWSDEHGWGIVREMVGTYQPSSLSITLRITDGFEDEDPVERCAGEVYYPDAAHAELFRGPMAKITEPVRARGIVTDTIVRTQDPLQAAVDLGCGDGRRIRRKRGTPRR